MNLITTQDWKKEELDSLLELAKKFKQKNQTDLLRGKSFGMWFLSPSLRTRVSFETAMGQLGGHAIFLSETWTLETAPIGVKMLEKTEHVKDAASVLSKYCDALGIRCLPDPANSKFGDTHNVLEQFAKYASIPIINMEDDTYHPCQALADILTIKEKKPRAKKILLTWAYHPKPLSCAVPDSVILIASRYGLDITLAHPPGFDLPEKILEATKANCLENGSTFEVVHDPNQGYSDADIIYAKSWTSPNYYGNPWIESQHRSSYRDWIVNQEKVNKSYQNPIFMHCLPVRRNVVAADDVLDGPNSVIYEQAANRLHVQKALLAKVMPDG